MESLIKAGAFDSLGHTRRGLLERHETSVDAVVGVKRKEAEGQFGLFDDGNDDDAPTFGLDLEFSPQEWEKSHLLAFEREMLGLYVSDHPLLGVEHLLSARTDCSIAALTGEERGDGAVLTIGGIISGLQRKMTKQGNAWAIATVEDLEGSIDTMFFPASYQLYGTQLAEDVVVVVKGRLDKREDVPRLVAMDLTLPDLNEGATNGPIVLTVPTNKVTPPLVARLKEILATHAGMVEVQLRLQSPARTTVMRLDNNLRVTPTPALMGDLKALLGPSCLA